MGETKTKWLSLSLVLYLTLWAFSAVSSRAYELDPLLSDAFWIWHARDSAAEEGKAYFFSTEFDIGSALVKKAVVRATTEGACTLVVNGIEVGSNDTWYELTAFDVRPHLVAGRNQLLVRVVPKLGVELPETEPIHRGGGHGVGRWDQAGLFVAGQIEFEGRESLPILSDGTWRAWWEGDETVKKAGVLVRGVDGGYWRNVTLLEMPEAFNRLNTGFVVPHIPWAKPYAGGKLKVLAIHSRWRQADTVGLAHRLDADVSAVFTDVAWKPGHRHPFFRRVKGATAKAIAAKLEAAMRKRYDLIIMGGVPAELFPEDLRERLRTHVQGGAALIIFGELPTNELTQEMTRTPVLEVPDLLAVGVPYENLPGLSVGPERRFPTGASLYEYGKGRVVRLDFGLLPADGDETRYEYYQSFLIKAVLWATGREPAVLFKEFPSVVTVDKQGGGMLALKFQLANSGEPLPCDIDLGICSYDKHLDLPQAPYARPGVHQAEKIVVPVRVARKTVNVDGTAAIEFDLPPLPAGEYFVNARVSKKGVNVNWATAHLTVTSKLAIEEVEVKPDWVDLSDGTAQQVRATVVLSEPAPKGASLELSLIDNYDRLLSHEKIILVENQVSARLVLSVPYMLTALGKVRAELKVDGESMDVAVGRFTCRRRDWDRFLFLAWGSGDRANQRLLADMGVDAYTGASGRIEELEVAERVALPGYAKMREEVMDTDPKVVEQAARRSAEIGRRSLPFDPIAYVSSDKPMYDGGETLPARVADFRKSLRADYGTIEALNAGWDTGYGAFDEIPAITGEVEKEFAEKGATTRNYSPIVDQWRENHRVFTERFMLHRDAVRQGDPHARVGTEAVLFPWSTNCFDWHALVKGLGLFAPNGWDMDLQTSEYATSWSEPGMLLGLTYGAYTYNGFVRRPETTDTEFHYWRPWNGLLRGYNCVWWYLLGPYFESGTGPGGEPYPALRTAVEQIARIRRGYYTLLRGSKRQHDGIAVHYSVPSNILGDRMDDFGRLPWDVHMLTRILLDHAPNRYRFVSPEQILNDELANYKALILPLSQAVSTQEAEAMERFVREGGLLIADVRPGLADEHGKFGANQALWKLFGIAYRKGLGRKLVRAELSGEYEGVPFNSAQGEFPIDPAFVLEGAEAALEVEGIPLLTSNRVGKGTAICLNVPFNWYRRWPVPDTMYLYLGDREHNVRVGNVLKAILKAHGIERAVKVGPVEGDWPWGLEALYSADGEAQYVGVTKRRGALIEPDRELVITAPRVGYLYDMFSGQYYGRKDTWKVTMPATDVRLYGLLPYKVKGLKVRLKERVVAQGATIEGQVDVRKGRGQYVRHVVHLQVIRPDGQAVRYLSRNLETEGGTASFSLPLAFNEPKGMYALTFTDVATQTSTSAGVSVQ